MNRPLLRGVLHQAAFFLALGVGAVVVPFAHGTRESVAAGIFAGSVVAMLGASALYHRVTWSSRVRPWMRRLDHAGIYLLIAGTYTPFTLLALRGVWGWSLFAIIWTLALVGILKDVLFHNRFRVVSVILYVLMGWLVIVAFGPLQRAVPPPGIAWLAAGGVVYTAGIVFYALTKRIAYGHGMWHLCVLGGSVCHYVAVLRYVPMA
jgi:hemolysin III